MANEVSIDQCLKTTDRIHSRVDTVEKTTASIETSAKNIEKCVYDMKSLIYGSEKSDGIVTKVSLLNQKVSGIYWLGGVVIIAFIGTLVGLLFKK
jgi:hypothetical protein